MFIILVAEFIGALVGLLLGWLTLMPSWFADQDVYPDSWVPFLCPSGINDVTGLPTSCDTSVSRIRNVLMQQTLSTFLFVTFILLIKDARTTPTQDGYLQGASIALCLFGQINVCSDSGSPCFNPAVALAQMIIGLSQITNSELHHAIAAYSWCYFVGPAIGGILAGFFMRVHTTLYDTKPTHAYLEDRDKELMPTN